MDTAEILKKVRQIEIQTDRLVSDTLAGDYLSTFKGQGIEFAEVREYTPGDDVRSIDWNVTARTGVPYIKKFNETRELTVMIACDVSASGQFGSVDKLKQEEDLNNFNTFVSPSDKNFSKLLWTKDPDHKYKLKHGLSTATRNIRARRFKTKMKYDKEEILEVAKKLKNIIDNGAANYDNKTNKTLETFDNNLDETNTVKSGFNNSKKKVKEKGNMNKSTNNILSIALDENDTFNQGEDSVANKNKKKNKKKKTNEGDNGIIKIDFAPSVYEESAEEKKLMMKKELREKYNELKDEYVQIKEKLNLPEFAEDKMLLNKKKKIKKELRNMKEQYKNEML